MQTMRSKGQKTLADRRRTIDELPLVERVAADPMFAADVAGLCTGLLLPQMPDDLLSRKPARLPLHPLAEENNGQTSQVPSINRDAIRLI